MEYEKITTNEDLRAAAASWMNAATKEDIEDTYGPIGDWDVSELSNFTAAFFQLNSFNEDISRWNTGAATSLQQMFDGCTEFNQDISGWDTSNVEDFGYMFYEASSFDQDLSQWNVGSATTFRGMFTKARSFTGSNLNYWGIATSKVTDMHSMFREAENFNQDISSWSVSEVTEMYALFYNATSFNQNLTSWDVQKVEDFAYAFEGTALDQQICWSIPPQSNVTFMFDRTPCESNGGCLCPFILQDQSARLFESTSLESSTVEQVKSVKGVEPILIAGMVGLAITLAVCCCFFCWRRKQPRTDPGPEEWRDPDDEMNLSCRWPGKDVEVQEAYNDPIEDDEVI